MSVVPGDVDTDHQPPLSVPLSHFVVGLGFLVAGLAVGVVALLYPGGLLSLVHLHLLLVGWVCLTIMGAMTQFVPVWSGVQLHSRRLATAQLWLLVGGLIGMTATLSAGSLGLTPLFGAFVLAGFWVFVYNIARTLVTETPLDVTERHFAVALGCFVIVTTLGVSLAIGFTRPVLDAVGLSRSAVVSGHATLAVFGGVVTTILGALYQLATMFTQTELHGVDQYLRRFETWGYPLGVVLLALGRLGSSLQLARVGGVLLVTSLLAFGVILARRLTETQVDWTPMLSRYTVAVGALVLWGLLTIPAWIQSPLAVSTLLGAPGTAPLLLLGVVGFVVFGTLYHVVPFIVWVHRYSDRLGYDPVPMIDDLYDDRLAAGDFWLLLSGTTLLCGSQLGLLPSAVTVVGSVIALLGTLVFVANIGLVIRTHSPHSVRGLLTDTT